MEMIQSSTLRVHDRSNVAEVRRAAGEHGRRLGWSDGARADAEIVATELATNLVKHARDGVVVLISDVDGAAGALVLMAIDRGPGLGDVAKCIEDGFSTAGSPGTGLGAIRRLSQQTEIDSSLQGPIVLTQIVRPVVDAEGRSTRSERAGAPLRHSPFHVAGFALPKEGEIVNGDAWAYRVSGRSLALLVCDGLGHGFEAAEASSRAVECFQSATAATPKEAMAVIHQALRPTRGAAAAVIHLDAAAGTARFCGVGNIVAGIILEGKTRHLVSHNGILGASAPRMTEFDYEWPSDATLLMHSDGISARWQPERDPHLWCRQPALTAGVVYRDLSRGTDDIAVVAVRENAPAH
jgi:anti-sigma regulatory factor (Ser/Thr protein kinase)